MRNGLEIRKYGMSQLIFFPSILHISLNSKIVYVPLTLLLVTVMAAYCKSQEPDPI